MDAIGRNVARYLCHLENGFINAFRCDTEVCGPLCPPVEIASTTFLKPGNARQFWAYRLS